MLLHRDVSQAPYIYRVNFLSLRHKWLCVAAQHTFLVVASTKLILRVHAQRLSSIANPKFTDEEVLILRFTKSEVVALGMRKTRYRPVKVHLQHLAIAAIAINLKRVYEWLNETPRATTAT